MQPPVLRRLRQLHTAVQAYRAEKGQEQAERQRQATAGLVSKAAQAAVSLVGSVASSVIPGVVASTSSSSSQRSGADQQQPKSLRLLKEAGVPIDDGIDGGGGAGSGGDGAMGGVGDAADSAGDASTAGRTTAAAAEAVLEALSSTLPGSGHNTRGSTEPPTPTAPRYHDPATEASAQAAQHTGPLPNSVRQQQQHHLNSPAGPPASPPAAAAPTSATAAAAAASASEGASDSADAGDVRSLPAAGMGHVDAGCGGGGSGSYMSCSNSSVSGLQVVSELSVNIDAEEGEFCVLVCWLKLSGAGGYAGSALDDAGWPSREE